MQHGDVRVLEAQDLRGPQKPCLLCWKPPRCSVTAVMFPRGGISSVSSLLSALLAPPPTARVAKKTPKPPDGSGESALCDVTLPISLPGEGPRPQPGVGPAPFETLFILCPQSFFGRGAVLLFTSKPSPSSSFFQRHHLFVSLGIPVHYSEVPQLPHDSASFFL